MVKDHARPPVPIIDKLTHENVLLKRIKFAVQSERYSAEQKSQLGSPRFQCNK